jgi:FkbM family methyltransferase
MRSEPLPALVAGPDEAAAAKLHADCVVLAGCDADYFRNFAIPFAHSLARNAGVGAALHLIIADPDEWIGEEIMALRSDVPVLTTLEVTTHPVLPTAGDARRTALACSRFIALPGLLRACRRPILVLDIDVLITGSLAAMLTLHAHADVVLVSSDGSNEKPWLRFVPSPLLVMPTAAGIAFADTLAHYVAHFLARGSAPWGLDRIGVAAAHADAMSRGEQNIVSVAVATWPVSASLDHNPDAMRAPAFVEYQPRLRLAFGWTLPGSDIFFPSQLAQSKVLLGRPTWEGPMLEASAAWFGRRRRALDIGAHVGFWSRWLAHHFAKVDAFEPQALLRECLLQNVDAKNLTLHAMALGERNGSIAAAFDPANSGMSHVTENVSGEIPLRRLDEFAFDDVDFVKLDAEGYELFVLRGGAETLRRNRPVVLVEQTEWNARYGLAPGAAIAFLESLGARQLARMSKYDFLLGWNES